MRSKRHADQPGRLRGRPVLRLEALEYRQLLAGGPFHYYLPTNTPAPSVNLVQPVVTTYHPQSISDAQLQTLGNVGKTLSGQDLEGDQWTITVHGPGEVIVTTTSPNAGVLIGDIDTIQLVGTNINTTTVTGEVTPTNRLVSTTAGTVFFNHLIDLSGVKSIDLNGFTLARTATPNPATALNTEPEIYLPGGVRFLHFHNIDALTDLALPIVPYTIQIGTATNPLPVQPVINLDSIFNTVVNSTVTTPQTGPQVLPTVNILVNGQLKDISFISTGAETIPAAYQFKFPTVGITGRTAIQALGIGSLNVAGSATNLTVARQSIPFRDGLSGLKYLGSARFGGNADAVGLDVSGPIGRLVFAHGLGNPTGTSISPTNWGTPTANNGYPAYGLLGGLVTATRIGSITAGAANRILLVSMNPNKIMQFRQGYTTWYPKAGNALTNAAIVSSGSIGQTTIVGNQQNSEIKSGFHYPSYLAGLEGTRAPSRIGPYSQRGDLIDSVVSATYRPVDSIYGNGNDIAGPGGIRGNLHGALFTEAGVTALNNAGLGFYARHRRGYLPPPQGPGHLG
jgi:hypothetical protein